jgi:hypothetical protein
MLLLKEQTVGSKKSVHKLNKNISANQVFTSGSETKDVLRSMQFKIRDQNVTNIVFESNFSVEMLVC